MGKGDPEASPPASLLVALAGCAHLDVVLNHLAKIGGVEVATQTVKGPLDPFMAIIMDGG